MSVLPRIFERVSTGSDGNVRKFRDAFRLKFSVPFNRQVVVAIELSSIGIGKNFNRTSFERDLINPFEWWIL